MKLIGIDIMGGSTAVLHNLREGWYPFGDYEKPDMEKPYRESDWERTVQGLYNVFENMPEVTVSSIVGNNGSGKSTLIDIMFRLINNLAYVILEQDKDQSVIHTGESTAGPGRELYYAYGLWASMYFETDGNLSRITCKWDDVEYALYDSTANKLKIYKASEVKGQKGIYSVLRQFFYTISCNYSQYAFRKDDYLPLTHDKEDEGVDGEWLSGLYHKNDGYVAPLVMTPYRKNGLIDFDNENKLSQQRLVVITILFYMQGRQFMEGYNPEHIVFSYDLKYRDGRINELSRRTQDFDTKDLAILMKAFQDSWKNYLAKEYEKKKKESLDNDFLKSDSIQKKLTDKLEVEFEITTYYLAYKSLKICLVYSNYQKLISIKKLARLAKQGGGHLKEYAESEFFKDKIKKIVNKQDGDQSHITLKIHQCITFYQTKLIDSKDHLMPIDDYIGSLKGKTYDDIVKGLPPAYYSVDVTMMPGKLEKKPKADYFRPETLARNDRFRKGEVRFSQMSSGQRQLMNSLSYIIYHIKNIQSIRNSKDTVAYKHINIVFDEAEMYAHPNFQRDFVYKLLEAIHWCHINTKKIKSIHILLATHSPFVLSDVLSQRSLYLEEGHPVDIIGQSFGGNYYELLENSFFFKESAIGRVSTERIQEWIEEAESEEKEHIDRTPFVGDPIVKRYLQEMKDKKGKWNYVQND